MAKHQYYGFRCNFFQKYLGCSDLFFLYLQGDSDILSYKTQLGQHQSARFNSAKVS